MTTSAAVAYMIDQATTTAMDAIEIGNVLAMYMEATQKRLRQRRRPGLGRHARHGRDGRARSPSARASATSWPRAPARPPSKLGHPELAMTVKGQGIPAYDPRGIKGMGLGYATSNRGACHLRGYTPAAEVVGNVLGPPTVTDPLAWKGKGELTMIFQNVHTITDCLDVCKFATFAESLDDFAAQFAAITGMPCTAGRPAEGRRARLQPGALLQQPGRLPRRQRHSARALPDGAVHDARLQGPGLRAGPDAGGVLRGPRLGERRRAGSEAEGTGDHLAPVQEGEEVAPR